MKLKSKLIATISAFCLVCVMLVVGIYALKSANFQMGGEISFKATGVNATISKGTLATGSHVNSSDATTKMQGFSITTAEDQDEINSLASSWSGLKLQFNEAGDDATITFTIKNDNTVLSRFLGVTITVNQGTVDNAKVTVSPEAAVIAPTKSQQFVVTFSVIKKDMDASLKGFMLDFALEHKEMQIATLDSNNQANGLTFSLNNTATVTACDNSITEVVIPTYVYNGSNIYTVTEISAGSIGANVETLTIPETVVNAHYAAFASANNISTVKFLSETPASWVSGQIMYEVFSAKNVQIYVPSDSVSAYKSAWSAIASNIHAIEE